MTQTLTLQAVGDIGFIGGIMERVRGEAGTYPFEAMKATFASGDLVFGNLEIPLLTSADRRRDPLLPATMVSTVEAAERLKGAGFHVLSLANNHVMDHGPEGLRSTLRALEAQGLLAVGAGENLAEARRPVLVEREGVRVGFLAYTSSHQTWADAAAPGAAPMKEDLVLEDVAALRARVDVLVVSLHFGLMYTDFPTVRDQTLLRRFLERGVDIVIGHHPHVTQGVEEYGQGLIAYSLGDFIFDPRAGNVVATEFLERRSETLALQCRFEAGRRVDWRVVPVVIGPDLAPRPAEGEIATRILARHQALSAPLAGDGLKAVDPEAEAGSRFVGHESKVLWHHLRQLHIGYLFGRLLNIRPRHFRFLLGAVRHRLRR